MQLSKQNQSFYRLFHKNILKKDEDSFKRYQVKKHFTRNLFFNQFIILLPKIWIF